MAQEQTGFIQMDDGSQKVRRVESVTLQTTGEDWVKGNTLVYDSSKTGIVLEYLPTQGNILRFNQTGSFPPVEIGDIISNNITGASSSIIAVESRADFQAVLTPNAGKVAYVAIVGQVTREWDGVVDSSLRVDQFNLSTPWTTGLGTSEFYSYGLHTDFTPTGYALLVSGDRAMPEIINRNTWLLEGRETPSRATLFTSGNTTYNTSTSTLIEFPNAAVDPDGWADAGGGIKIPTGVERIDIDVQMKCDVALAAGHLSIIMEVNGAPNILGNGGPTNVVHLTLIDLDVAPTDILTFHVLGVTVGGDIVSGSILVRSVI